MVSDFSLLSDEPSGEQGDLLGNVEDAVRDSIRLLPDILPFRDFENVVNNNSLRHFVTKLEVPVEQCVALRECGEIVRILRSNVLNGFDRHLISIVEARVVPEDCERLVVG